MALYPSGRLFSKVSDFTLSFLKISLLNRPLSTQGQRISREKDPHNPGIKADGKKKCIVVCGM
jgi:hypothetical protein